MGTFRVELGPSSHPVHVAAGLLEQLGRLVREAGFDGRSVALVTDSTVGRHYAKPAIAALKKAGISSVTIEVPAGEASKSLAMLASGYERLADAELDRTGAVIALGGGVVGDLAGFLAATWLRGVALIQVPTSLTAQVDSALGGKTGVNLERAKNLVGAFYQPRAIIADVATLRTLPDREFREGLAEVIKYGAIMDAAMIGDLERDLDRILARDLSALELVVERSLRHKAAVVSADERESGLRKTLNFGHTIGHAIEATSGYGKFLHGEAVAIGMAAAVALSERHAGLSSDEGSRLMRLIARAGLATSMPADQNSGELLRALRLDKKRSGDEIEFVLIDRLGHALTRKLGFDAIAKGLV